MKEIETELYKLHEQLRLQHEQQPMDIDENQAINQKPALVPFARVDRVDAGSPSEKAVSSISQILSNYLSESTIKNIHREKGGVILNTHKYVLSQPLLSSLRQLRFGSFFTIFW